jgi:hypothetical protein
MLAANQYLTILNVGGTSLGRKGLKKLLKGLVQNQTLLSLNLKQNDISGAGCEDLFSALVKTNVKELNI